MKVKYSAEQVELLREETQSQYAVASSLTVDWCPCCGVNVRLRDNDGKLFAKFITTPIGARKLGLDLIRQADNAAKAVN